MDQIMAILNKYNVTPCELATWLTSQLETIEQNIEDKIDDNDPDRIDGLFVEINKLCWRLTPKEQIDAICERLNIRDRLIELGFIVEGGR
ncbi:MAG: hypothetical protein Q8911_00165 [Bacillota bacterium]|nr:hypothetical protein [Bacillota bacterium]